MKLKLVKSKTRQTKGLECLNCRLRFNGHENFCSYCGQKNVIDKLSFGVFVTNLFSGFLSYDSRFWRTFIPLLTKPGKVSRDFIEGKRVRFVNPFRLYLHVSIIFFLILGVSTKIGSDKIPDNILTLNNKVDSIATVENLQIDSILNDVIAEIPDDSTRTKVVSDLGSLINIIEEGSNKSREEYTYQNTTDSIKSIGFLNKLMDFENYNAQFPNASNLQGLDSLGYEKTFWNKLFFQQIINIKSNIEELDTKKGIQNLINKLTSYISISLFIFLPVFALFLKLLYIRRGYSYMEHLVFVFHTQTVFFILLLIVYLLNLFVKADIIIWLFIVLFSLYLYMAMRTFYKQGRSKTVLKFILLNSYYLFLAIFGFIIITVLSFIGS